MIGIAILFGLAICGLALRAGARLRNEERLPMQWWLTGEVTWTAPRVPALAFIPVVAICVLAAYVMLALNMKPRAGQEEIVFPTLIVIGVIFMATELLHLWLIDKTLRRKAR